MDKSRLILSDFILFDPPLFFAGGRSFLLPPTPFGEPMITAFPVTFPEAIIIALLAAIMIKVWR